MAASASQRKKACVFDIDGTIFEQSLNNVILDLLGSQKQEEALIKADAQRAIRGDEVSPALLKWIATKVNFLCLNVNVNGQVRRVSAKQLIADLRHNKIEFGFATSNVHGNLLHGLFEKIFNLSKNCSHDKIKRSPSGQGKNAQLRDFRDLFGIQGNQDLVLIDDIDDPNLRLAKGEGFHTIDIGGDKNAFQQFYDFFNIQPGPDFVDNNPVENILSSNFSEEKEQKAEINASVNLNPKLTHEIIAPVSLKPKSNQQIIEEYEQKNSGGDNLAVGSIVNDVLNKRGIDPKEIQAKYNVIKDSVDLSPQLSEDLKVYLIKIMGILNSADTHEIQNASINALTNEFLSDTHKRLYGKWSWRNLGKRICAFVGALAAALTGAFFVIPTAWSTLAAVSAGAGIGAGGAVVGYGIGSFFTGKKRFNPLEHGLEEFAETLRNTIKR